MAILVDLNELHGMQPAISGVEQGSANSASIGNVIREFKSSIGGSALRGEIWKTEGEKLDIYTTATQKSQSIGDKMVAALNSTISAIDGAWDSRFGTSMKDTYRDEVENNLIIAEANLAECQAYLDSLPKDSPHIPSAIRAVEEAQAIVNELRDLLAAVDRFLAVYNSEMSKLDELISELDSGFGNMVNDITATSLWNFMPNSEMPSDTRLGTNIDQIAHYTQDYSIPSDGYTVSTDLYVIPRDTPPQVIPFTSSNGSVVAVNPYDNPPENAMLYTNGGFTHGIIIENSTLKYINPRGREESDREVMYFSNGMVETFPNSVIMDGGTNPTYNEDKISQAIEDYNIDSAASVFGTLYRRNEDGSEFVYYNDAPTDSNGYHFNAAHENARRPRIGIGQYEDGDYFIVSVNGDKNGNGGLDGMTIREFYDYAMETAEAQGGKEVRNFILEDGGGSLAVVERDDATGEYVRVDTTTDKSTGADYRNLVSCIAVIDNQTSEA